VLRLLAASTERARVVELFQIQNDEGPCLDCYRSGRPVIISDIRADHTAARWPQFAAAAREMGYAGVHAIPMRLRDQVIGTLNLFRTAPDGLTPAVVVAATALVDVATIGILQERAVRQQEVVAGQLQVALNSRVIIEQAKGKLAERLGIDVNQAFTLLRDQARNRNQRLSDLARAFVDGTQAISGPAGGSVRASRPGTRQPRPGPRPAP
jgi:GAF domain-containing protein